MTALLPCSITEENAEEESHFVRHVPCPSCGSKDNAGLYSNGWITCFSPGCDYRGKEDGSTRGRHAVQVTGSYQPLPHRKLTAETCRQWHYTVQAGGEEVAHYTNREGRVVGTKVRRPGKEFTVSGKITDQLYGRHRWRDAGKRLVITEGEIDAMSYSQVVEHKYPVVSIPNGGSGAVKSIKANLEWVESFEEVVLMFDMDEPGQEAAKAVADLLSPGKAMMAELPCKDANECLVQGKTRELIDAFWSAKAYRPDGIVKGSLVTQKLASGEHRTSSEAYATPWPNLNDAMDGGLRKREMFVLGAGTGQGKTYFTREIAKALLDQGLTIGYLSLEEEYITTAGGIAAFELNTPLSKILTDPDCSVTNKDLAEAWGKYEDRCHLYDHWGSQAVDTVLAKMRYMVQGLNCDFIIFDHLSLLLSGLALKDERKAIDMAMTALRKMCSSTGCGMVLVTHLSRPNSGETPHEEGGRVTLRHLRGSHSIGQLADIAVGLERNQQDKELSRFTTVRVVKPYRLNGFTGVAARTCWNEKTGRLEPTKIEDEWAPSDGFKDEGNNSL